MAFRTLFLVLVLVALAQAFVPSSSKAFASSKTQLQFGFLKDLGIEKPSWLPDFGGKKKEEEKAEDSPAAATDGENTMAAATTTDDAPAEAVKED